MWPFLAACIEPTGLQFVVAGLKSSALTRLLVLPKPPARRTMPFGNKTGMTDEERELLGRWIEQGAIIQ